VNVCRSLCEYEAQWCFKGCSDSDTYKNSLKEFVLKQKDFFQNAFQFYENKELFDASLGL